MIGGRIFDGTSGAAVVGASVSVAATDRGSLTDGQGRFLIRRVLDDAETIEVVIRHPCFHTVRVEVLDGGDGVLEVGLPFRAAAPEVRLGYCRSYGPAS